MKITWTVTYTLRNCTITRTFSDLIKACECEYTARKSGAKDITCETNITH